MEITIKIENDTVKTNSDVFIDDSSIKLSHRLRSIEKLLKVAELVNRGWTPNWNDDHQLKYFLSVIRCAGENMITFTGTSAQTSIDKLVYFKTLEAAKQTVKFLGEETVINALIFK